MILEEETFKKFGYHSKELSKKSHKKIIAKCDNCGLIRELNRGDYHNLCHKCACNTKEHIEKLSLYKNLEIKLENQQSIIRTNKDLTSFGYRKSGKANGIQKWIDSEYRKKYEKELEIRNGDKTKIYQKQWRENNEKEILEKNKEWRKTPSGKISKAKHHYKRKQYGFLPLFQITNFKDIKTEWHHIAINRPYVIPVPSEIHRKIGGSKKEHYKGVTFLFYKWLNKNPDVKIIKFQSKDEELLIENIMNDKMNYLETFKNYSDLISWLDSINMNNYQGEKK